MVIIRSQPGPFNTGPHLWNWVVRGRRGKEKEKVNPLLTFNTFSICFPSFSLPHYQSYSISITEVSIVFVEFKYPQCVHLHERSRVYQWSATEEGWPLSCGEWFIFLDWRRKSKWTYHISKGYKYHQRHMYLGWKNQVGPEIVEEHQEDELLLKV